MQGRYLLHVYIVLIISSSTASIAVDMISLTLCYYISPTIDDFIKELCDTWRDHLDDETDDDCLNNSCVLSDRDRSNSFDDAIQFDDYIEAMLCDDTSLDAAMMLWDDADTGTAGHQSEKEVVVFEAFGMHKP